MRKFFFLRRMRHSASISRNDLIELSLVAVVLIGIGIVAFGSMGTKSSVQNLNGKYGDTTGFLL